MILSPATALSDSTLVTAASASFTIAMGADKLYLFTSSTACWIKQGTGAQTASAADGNMFVPAGLLVTINGTLGDTLAVIRDAADGKASLTPALTF